jgi:hypothetical protein
MIVKSKKVGSNRRPKKHEATSSTSLWVSAWQTQGEWADVNFFMDGRKFQLRLTAVEVADVICELQKVPVRKERS